MFSIYIILLVIQVGWVFAQKLLTYDIAMKQTVNNLYILFCFSIELSA